MKAESNRKKELKLRIANYQQQIKDWRRLKSDHQLQVKLCDKNIKQLQSYIAKRRLELKQEA